MSLEQEPRWNELRSILGGHIVQGHDEIDTINRLLRKNPWLNDRGIELQIPKANLRITDELWELERLWRLIHAAQVTEQRPGMPGGAVVVLRWDTELLIDGRRRINQWKRRSQVGPHRVLIVARDYE